LIFSRTWTNNTYSTKLHVGIALQTQVIVPNLRAPTHALSNSDQNLPPSDLKNEHCLPLLLQATDLQSFDERQNFQLLCFSKMISLLLGCN
jgi:hypothetical protein